MSIARGFIDRLLLAAATLAIVGAAGVVRAQDDFEEFEEAPVVVDQGFGMNGIFELDANQFNQWVFGGRDPDGARRRLDSLLSLQVDDIDRACGMTDAQKAKLRLAGVGDIKRFFDRVEQKREKFQKVKNDRNQIGQIYQELQPLQLAYNSGMFGDTSLFSKVLKRTLTEGQFVRYEQVLLQGRRKFRYKAKVDLVVATLGNALGLNGDQRRRFAKVLMEETRPPKSFGQDDYRVVMFQAARLPEGKIKPIFSDAQWRTMSGHLVQAKAMEQYLRSNGFVPDDAPADPLARPAEANGNHDD